MSSLPANWQAGWARKTFDSETVARIVGHWWEMARIAQYPVLDIRDTWLVVGGRGSGKTRLGAEWVDGVVHGRRPFALNRHDRLALVGETLGDVREVMIDGASGIMSLKRRYRPTYEPSRRRLVWPNGAVAQVFSSEDPESLRGPQFAAAWCDELAKWAHADACWDMLQFGMRLGDRPRQLVTTTPRPIALLRRLLADPGVTLTRMATVENAGNLAPGFLDAVNRRYAGTRLGRQELDGEMIDDRPDALWTRAALEAARGEARPLRRVVVAVDPPASARRSSDACGLIVAGLCEDGTGVVLEDATIGAASPQRWAQKAVALYHRHEADCIVAEVNQGGDMVTTVIRMVDAAVPVKPVRATRGKWLRAEPVAALYEQGRVRHAAAMPALEDEMCDFGTDGLSGGHSPDRVDALVWALSELMLGRDGAPRVRNFR